MKLTTTSLITILALTGLFILAADFPADKDIITFSAKMGTVTFQHQEHAERINDCTRCHHMTEGDAVPQPCSACHMPKEEKDGAPKLKTAVHNSCQGCHQEHLDAGKTAGPVKGVKECKKCHIKDAS